MPIRINLLAEDQALEEARRRDPVKRAYMAAALIVAAVLVWCSTLQVKIMTAKSEYSGLQAKWNSIEKNYQVALSNQRNVLDSEQKLLALQRLTTNRLLWGTALNALQKSVAGVDDVQVIRLKCEQSFTFTEEVKARTNNGVVIPGKPANSIERASIVVEAIDTSTQPGANVNKFKLALSSVPYFRDHLQKTNGVLLTSFSQPQASVTGQGQFSSFALQCNFPEKVR